MIRTDKKRRVSWGRCNECGRVHREQKKHADTEVPTEENVEAIERALSEDDWVRDGKGGHFCPECA